MKQGYETPSMDVVSVTACDVIVTSGIPGMNVDSDGLTWDKTHGTDWGQQ